MGKNREENNRKKNVSMRRNGRTVTRKKDFNVIKETKKDAENRKTKKFDVTGKRKDAGKKKRSRE